MAAQIPQTKSAGRRRQHAPARRRSAKRRQSPRRPVPRAHGRFDYSPIVDRPPLRWPNGARVALWVIPNIEHFLFDRPATRMSDGAVALNPDVLNYSWRDYGVRVGIWRMMEIMERYGVQRHGRAQLRRLPATIRASSRRARSSAGSGWATAPPTPSCSATRPRPRSAR